jgi:hypothetical protein
MTKTGFAAFDKAEEETDTAARPDPSNLQVAATDLIDDQDLVGTFDPNAAAKVGNTAAAQLVTDAKANPLPRVLPAHTGSASNSVRSRSTRSLMTESIFTRMSQMEGTLAKVDKLDEMMNLITAKLGIGARRRYLHCCNCTSYSQSRHCSACYGYCCLS